MPDVGLKLGLKLRLEVCLLTNKLYWFYLLGNLKEKLCLTTEHFFLGLIRCKRRLRPEALSLRIFKFSTFWSSQAAVITTS